LQIILCTRTQIRTRTRIGNRNHNRTGRNENGHPPTFISVKFLAVSLKDQVDRYREILENTRESRIGRKTAMRSKSVSMHQIRLRPTARNTTSNQCWDCSISESLRQISDCDAPCCILSCTKRWIVVNNKIIDKCSQLGPLVGGHHQ
jgi:hypothetical protein